MNTLSIAELRKIATDHNICIDSCTSKESLQQIITNESYKEINDLNTQIEHFESIIVGLKNKQKNTLDIIKSVCVHNYKSEVSYGDRTSWICVYCGMYR